MTQLLPPKKEVALALLERSNVDIYLDPRSEGVVVPPQFRKEPRLILKIGLNMPVPIPDLRLDDESMSCTLSFNRQKFFCVVPWLSVFAMVGDDGRGMVWPDDVPQELAQRAEDRPRQGGLAEAPAPPSSRSGAGKGKQLRLQTEMGEVAPSSERGGKGKRTAAGAKKKKDEAPARPMLHAVPSPPPSSPKLEKLEKVSEKSLEKASEKTPAAEKAAEEKAAPAAAPAPRPAATGRPKRELPPYLRVVK